jgi:hypothetical protein
LQATAFEVIHQPVPGFPVFGRETLPIDAFVFLVITEFGQFVEVLFDPSDINGISNGDLSSIQH